jgi:hypothetical protein
MAIIRKVQYSCSILLRSFFTVLHEDIVRTKSLTRLSGGPVYHVPPELTDEARERVPNDAKRLAACVTLRNQRIFRWRHMPNAAAMLRLRRFLL